ncbi:MAG: NAD-binding protein [bacterium]|nr:NAD-binding protein [bacterium]
MRNLLYLILRRVRRNLLRVLLLFILIVYLSCLITVMLYKKTSLPSALMFLLPAFLGELQDLNTDLAEIARLVALANYVLFLSIIVTKISEKIINLALSGGVTLNKVNYKGHIMICGWNYQAPKIIESLLSSDIHSKKQIVILADFERVPYNSDRVDFIKGFPWKNEDLIRAGVFTADIALVLSDINGKSSNPDADALLTVLAIERLNKSVYTCVQILSSENKIHFENAGADEIICLDELGSNLLISSSLNPGISKLVSSLLIFGEGTEIYKYKKPIPERFINKSLSEIAKSLIDKDVIAFAIETEKDEHINGIDFKQELLSLPNGRALIINPPKDYRFRKGDSLFIMCKEEPEEL